MPQLRLKDMQFLCWMKDEDENDCTFSDKCGLEVGRHGHIHHHLPKEDIKWAKIFNKVGIVDEKTGKDLRHMWGRSGIKYKQGIFVPAPATDSEDSWLYKLFDVQAKKDEWKPVSKSRVEAWKRQAAAQQGSG